MDIPSANDRFCIDLLTWNKNAISTHITIDIWRGRETVVVKPHYVYAVDGIKGTIALYTDLVGIMSAGGATPFKYLPAT